MTSFLLKFQEIMPDRSSLEKMGFPERLRICEQAMTMIRRHPRLFGGDLLGLMTQAYLNTEFTDMIGSFRQD
jgi:hypothetical protein